MPFQRKTSEEPCVNNTRKKSKTTSATVNKNSPLSSAGRGSTLRSNKVKEGENNKPIRLRQQKRTKQNSSDNVGGQARTPRALQGQHSPTPNTRHRRMQHPSPAHLSFSPPVDITPSPRSGRKTAGMHFPAASSVRSIRDYLSNSIWSGRSGGACCTPNTDSQVASPAGSLGNAKGEPFVPEQIKARDSIPSFSEFDSNIVDSFSLKLEEYGESNGRNTPTASFLPRGRKCETPNVMLSSSTPSLTDAQSTDPDVAEYCSASSRRSIRWRQTSFDQGHLQKRCQYLEAEVEYLRDRETELRDRLCLTQAENTQLTTELQAQQESYREALTAKRKFQEAYSDQTQAVNRIHVAYNKATQEVKDLKAAIEMERAQWMESVRCVQEDLEKERARTPVYRPSTPRTPAFTDTDTDISLNDCFEDGSMPPSSDFQEGNLNSSHNNSPGPSPRTLDDIRVENKRLQDENKKLREECQSLEVSRQKYQRKQKLEMLKQEGNKAFQAGQYEEALNCYTAAFEEVDDDRHMQAVLHCNKAVTLFNMEKYLEAIVCCCCAIECDATYPRAFQRRACAYEAIGDLSAASQDLTYLINSRRSSTVSREAQIHLTDLQRKEKRTRSLDAYKILGLSASATGAEIKTQYRRLALLFHPDKARNQPGADEAFKLVSQAYDLLSDEAKRSKFDATRLQPSRSSSPWL